jgi:hypothetical protein
MRDRHPWNSKPANLLQSGNRMDLDRKLKTALDESRLLILGAQVLFGFLFQAVFQDLFKDVPPASQGLQCVGLDLCF